MERRIDELMDRVEAAETAVFDALRQDTATFSLKLVLQKRRKDLVEYVRTLEEHALWLHRVVGDALDKGIHLSYLTKSQYNQGHKLLAPLIQICGE